MKITAIVYIGLVVIIIITTAGINSINAHLQCNAGFEAHLNVKYVWKYPWKSSAIDNAYENLLFVTNCNNTSSTSSIDIVFSELSDAMRLYISF